MGHFAKIENNIVTQVIVVDNDKFNTEEEGIIFCNNLIPGEWVQTSYNNNFRGKFASIGDLYINNTFIPWKPFDSWVLNEDTLEWEAPIQRPGENYYWDEYSLSWIERDPIVLSGGTN